MPVCPQEVHERLKRDTGTFLEATTHFAWWTPVPDEPSIELRNCLCGSTLCREPSEP